MTRADVRRALRVARRLMSDTGPYVPGQYSQGCAIEARIRAAMQPNRFQVFAGLRFAKRAEHLEAMRAARVAGNRPAWENALGYLRIWAPLPDLIGLPR